MLLDARHISKSFAPSPGTSRALMALDDVSIQIDAGETLGLVGPSGSGKSTLARVIARLIQPDRGDIQFDGTDWLAASGAKLRARRAAMQMVFQDPAAAFHPHASVTSALTDPLRIHRLMPRKDWPDEVARLLQQVELSADLANRAIRDLSGGQRQRIAIARALACGPKLVILDEAVSALDVSVRGRIIALLVALQRKHGLAYLFVSHDLALVRQLAHRTAVMSEGRILETGPTQSLISAPKILLTRQLIDAIPQLPSPQSTPQATLQASADNIAPTSAASDPFPFPSESR